MARTFAHRVAWQLERTGYSAMLHFIRATMQENRTEACKRPLLRPKGTFVSQSLFTGHGERRIAAATNVTNSTKDSVKNVKNETNSTQDIYIGYLDDHTS